MNSEKDGRSAQHAVRERDLFALTGSAGEIGRQLGRLGARVLRARVREMLRLARRSGIPETELTARAADLRRTLLRVAPAWVDEAAGMAAAAGVDAAQVLMLNTPPPGLYRRAGAECTSFVHVGEHANLLLKIRDERNRIQHVVVMAARGRPLLQVGRDIGNLGAAHAVNAHAVALGCNTGSHLEAVDDAGRLNDCLMLRYFAEHAQSVRDIPRLYESLADAGVAGGASSDRGAIYLAADPSEGLILETGWSAAHATRIRKGTVATSNHFQSTAGQKWAARPPNRNTQVRLCRMQECLSECADLDPVSVFAITRDRRHAPHALCNDDRHHFWMTNSAWLHVLPHGRAEDAVSYVCCGNTRQSIFLPLPIACRESWGPWASGDFYRASDRLYRARACRTALPGRRVRELETRGLIRHESPAALWREALALMRSVP